MEKDASYLQACTWAQGQLAAGTHPEALVMALRNQGWQESQARQVLDGAIVGEGARAAAPVMQYATPVARRGRAASGGSSSNHAANMLLGALICGVGIVITVGTYAMASSGGGTYVIFWGAIIFGAVRFLKGFIGWTSGS